MDFSDEVYLRFLPGFRPYPQLGQHLPHPLPMAVNLFWDLEGSEKQGRARRMVADRSFPAAPSFFGELKFDPYARFVMDK